MKTLCWNPLCVCVIVIGLSLTGSRAAADEKSVYEESLRKGEIYADCAVHARRLLQGWLDHKVCPKTSLVSRCGQWNYYNQAADYYSSLVVVAHYVNPAMNKPGGRLHDTMLSYRNLCLDPNGLPRNYDLKTFTPDRLATFGELAEFLKDGLIRITEITGKESIWFKELVRLTDTLLAEAEHHGGMAEAFGHERWFPAEENAGNMLQTLARLYMMTGGEEKFLAAAEELAIHWLKAFREGDAEIILSDHGGEIIPGLAEWFVVESRFRPDTAARYRPAIARILYKVMRYSHPVTGLFVERPDILPREGWGYTLFAYENYDLATGEGRYTEFIKKPMQWLLDNRSKMPASPASGPNFYREHLRLIRPDIKHTLWPQSDRSDDWSDLYESFIILWKRYRLEGGFDWLDWATRQHVHRMRTEDYMRHIKNHRFGLPPVSTDADADSEASDSPDYGPYTGRHFDGSTGRTLIIHMLLSSKGVYGQFDENLRIGSVKTEDGLFLTAACSGGYEGKLYFDSHRFVHGGKMVDWTRINEVPKWFVVDPQHFYRVSFNDEPPVRMRGRSLIEGVPVTLEDAQILCLNIRPE